MIFQYCEAFENSKNLAVKDAVRCGRLEAFMKRLFETGDLDEAAEELPLAIGVYLMDKRFRAFVERAVCACHAPAAWKALTLKARQGNVYAAKTVLHIALQSPKMTAFVHAYPDALPNRYRAG